MACWFEAVIVDVFEIPAFLIEEIIIKEIIICKDVSNCIFLSYVHRCHNEIITLLDQINYFLYL